MPSPSIPLASAFPSPPEWLASLGVTGVDPNLLTTAFTHPSYRSLDPAVESYERLEFLGDAVLNLIVADMLFRNMPGVPEGVLTERRAALVNRDALAGVFDFLGLLRFVRTAPEYLPSLKDKGNVVEALFGAIIIGRDLATCQLLWDAISPVLPGIPDSGNTSSPLGGGFPTYLKFGTIYDALGITAVATHNAKNALQELCQKQGLPPPKYDEVTRTGPDHNPLFQVRLVLHPFATDRIIEFEATGQGSTRKAAEIQADSHLCDQINLPYTPQ
jgi:ribonuclease-3